MTRPWRIVVGAAALTAVAALAGCESTQDKSDRLRKQAKRFVNKQKGVVVTRTNRQVKVTDTTVLHDENGTAVVAELSNSSPKIMAGVPVSIDVKSGANKSLFRNDTPGLEPALTSVAVLPPREDLFWVNDQVPLSGTPKDVDVKVGVARGQAPAKPPKLEVSRPKFQGDPTSGIAAVGYVKNESKLLQTKVTVFCVARKGGRVIAAGRSGIQRIKPGRRGRYKVFFIGNPRGGRLEAWAPPTVLR